jgi:hypothetical protein
MTTIVYIYRQHYVHKQAQWEGISASTSVRGPESQERACKSLKDLKSSILREVSLSPGPQSRLVLPWKISLGGPVYKLVCNAHYIVCVHCSKYHSFTITMVFDASMVVTNLMLLVFICPYWCQTRLPDVTCIYLPILMSNTITISHGCGRSLVHASIGWN